MPRVLLIGDEQHPEFRAATDWLREHTELIVAATGDDARGELARRRGVDDGPPLEPDVMVVAQSRPGQFAAQDLEQLHGLAPLARLVALLGSWCEGETRTGHPWPGVMRLFWHEWQPRFARELLRNDVAATWHLPRTVTDVEQLLHQRPQSPPHQLCGHAGLIAIHTYDVISFDCLADAGRIGGYAVARVPPDALHAVRGASAAIFDSRMSSDAEFETLKKFAESLRPVPVVAILSFPRLDDCSRALAAGAVAVIGKPFLVDDLLWQIETVVRTVAEAA